MWVKSIKQDAFDNAEHELVLLAANKNTTTEEATRLISEYCSSPRALPIFCDVYNQELTPERIGQMKETICEDNFNVTGEKKKSPIKARKLRASPERE